jgi:hypothetical protein
MAMDNDQPKVFVLNYAGHNLEDAKRFGQVINLTEGNFHFEDIDRMKYTMVEKLTSNGFDPDRDYLLLSGSVILGYLIGRALDAGMIKLLLWDAKNHKYVQREEFQTEVRDAY